MIIEAQTCHHKVLYVEGLYRLVPEEQAQGKRISRKLVPFFFAKSAIMVRKAESVGYLLL